jgi:hypothetical protein
MNGQGMGIAFRLDILNSVFSTTLYGGRSWIMIGRLELLWLYDE